MQKGRQKDLGNHVMKESSKKVNEGKECKKENKQSNMKKQTKIEESGKRVHAMS
jgi:hypothetical protein